MNLMHGAFAVGAIIGPLAVGALIGSGLHWTGVYRGMAAIFVLLTVLMLLMPMPVTAHQPAEHEAAPKRLSAHPAYWLSFFALFLYVGVELGVSNWVAEYFVAVFAWSPAAGAMLVSLFWAGLLAGRFGVPLLYTGGRQELVLVWLSALATLAILLLSALGFAEPGRFTNHFGQVLVFFAGLGCSIYYPAVITLLGKCFPHAAESGDRLCRDRRWRRRLRLPLPHVGPVRTLGHPRRLRHLRRIRHRHDRHRRQPGRRRGEGKGKRGGRRR